MTQKMEWKYTRLKKLSEDQLRWVNNALIQGESSLHVARQIMAWGLLCDMKEATLARQLGVYRTYKLGALKPDPDLMPIQVAGPAQTARFNAMEELRVLAQQQQARVNNLLLAEETSGTHNGLVTSEIGNYASLLKDVLKAEFDCGDREFKGPLPGMKGVTASVSVAGTHIDVTLKDAVESASQILAKHAPRLIEGSRA